MAAPALAALEHLETAKTGTDTAQTEEAEADTAPMDSQGFMRTGSNVETGTRSETPGQSSGPVCECCQEEQAEDPGEEEKGAADPGGEQVAGLGLQAPDGAPLAL